MGALTVTEILALGSYTILMVIAFIRLQGQVKANSNRIEEGFKRIEKELDALERGKVPLTLYSEAHRALIELLNANISELIRRMERLERSLNGKT